MNKPIKALETVVGQDMNQDGGGCVGGMVVSVVRAAAAKKG